ncbi:MAG: hypothetical protein H0W15_05985 [Gemmatimonadales bacterium]|nr:hypothetical protein [Gemmatimonadales bacterium]
MRHLTLSLAFLAVAPLAAQDRAQTEWTLHSARGGFCIWYLADPEMVGELLPKDVVTQAASAAGTSLPPALARVIQDEPRFASWVPGAICVGVYASASVDGKEVVAAKEGDRVTVITHSLAAVDPRGIAAARHYLIELGTDRGSLARAGELAGVRTYDRSVDINKVPGSDDDEIELKLDKAKILWQGHPTGPSRVDSTRVMSFGYAGLRLSSWEVQVKAAPMEMQAMVGALRIEGKDDLSRVLRASPIRFVGPIERGGVATFRFTPGGRK